MGRYEEDKVNQSFIVYIEKHQDNNLSFQKISTRRIENTPQRMSEHIGEPGAARLPSTLGMFKSKSIRPIFIL